MGPSQHDSSPSPKPPVPAAGHVKNIVKRAGPGGARRGFPLESGNASTFRVLACMCGHKQPIRELEL